MISKKTYIPAKPRNRKLVNVSGGGGIGRSDISGVVENSHEHPNKVVIDQILQQHLDVLGVLSIVDGNLKIDASAYSTGELSAYGIGSGGSSGGGVDLLQAWTDYDVTKDNWAVKAGLLVPFYTDATSRLSALESGAALSLSPVGSGNGIASITKSGTVLTVTKANFAELDVNGKILSSQLPSYVDDVLEYVNLAAFPATGETGKIYIAQDSNKTYRWSGTAYVEISASLALGETSSTAYRGDRGKIAYDHSQLTGNPHGTTFAQIVSRPTTITGYGITDAYTKTEVNSALTSKLDKSVFDDLFVKVNKGTEAAPIWAIEAKYNFYSLGEVSAYGIGSGGGGGSYDRLDAWADYNSTKSGWVLSALLGNELNTRVGNLEGGSALTVNTTGTGNAITSISKAGTVITAEKGLTFSLGSHLHTGVYEPVFTKNTAFNKNFGTTAGTVAEGNDSRINNGQTAYGWGNHASAGYALNSSLSSYLPLTGGTLTGNLIIQPASQVSFGHGIRLNDVGGWAGLLIGGATGTTSGHDGTTNWWVASNPDDVFMINPLGSLVGQGLDIYRNGDIKWKGNNIYHSGNLSPVTTNTVQTITAQKTFSDGDAVYGLAAKPSIILGGDNTTNAGVIKLWGNTAGAYGLIQATGVDLELSASSSTGSVYIQHYGAGNVYLATGGGNVGIGAGARPATEKLQVDGNIKSSGKIDALSIGSKFGPNDGITSLPALGVEGNTFGIGGFYGFRFNVLSNGNGNLQIGRFSGSATAYNLILQSQGGNVGIGEPSPSVKLHVAGNILSTGEITAYVASDRRLKHNITTLLSSLDIIDKLNPVSYYWNAKAKELNPMKSDSLDYGLIAQEVENVLPGVVHGIFDDKYKSIDYIKLIPIMIAAIKELKQKVNKL